MTTLRDLERQSGLLRLLVYLMPADSYVVKLLRDHDIPNNQLIRSINQLTRLKLITSTPDIGTFPQRKMLSLTKKGRLVAMHLTLIGDLLAND